MMRLHKCLFFRLSSCPVPLNFIPTHVPHRPRRPSTSRWCCSSSSASRQPFCFNQPRAAARGRATTGCTTSACFRPPRWRCKRRGPDDRRAARRRHRQPRRGPGVSGVSCKVDRVGGSIREGLACGVLLLSMYYVSKFCMDRACGREMNRAGSKRKNDWLTCSHSGWSKERKKEDKIKDSCVGGKCLCGRGTRLMTWPQS